MQIAYISHTGWLRGNEQHVVDYDVRLEWEMAIGATASANNEINWIGSLRQFDDDDGQTACFECFELFIVLWCNYYN